MAKQKGKIVDMNGEDMELDIEIPEEIKQMRESAMVQLKSMVEEFDQENFGPREKIAVVTVLADICENMTEMFLILEFEDADRQRFYNMIQFMGESAVQAATMLRDKEEMN